MFAALALSLLASTAAALPQASAEIAPVTPASLVQCQPILLQWSGGKAPYYVSLIPGVGNPSAAAVVDFGKLDGTSETWMVNQPVDTDLTLKIVDSDGKYQFSAPVKVQKGSSDECLKETGSGAGPAATGSDAPAASEDAKDTGAAPTDAAKETSVAPQGAAETGTSAPAAATSTGAAAASGAASSAKSADASHTSSASGSTASKAPAPSTSSSGAGRIVASTGLIAAVVAAVAFF